ncbi:MAG: ATP-binding protein [Lachnospiraceae bacterium]|nr:ATP-binding protein [Lachnospiraceae bacterium]
MLKKVEIRNYRTFKGKITIDFTDIGNYDYCGECLENEIITKMLIYGKNSTGKTNLGKAILDIQNVLGSAIQPKTRFLLNADSVNSDVHFLYLFEFGGNELIYEYTKDTTGQLLDESMSYNKNRVFYIDFERKTARFDGLNYLEEGAINYNRFWNNYLNNEEETRLPFLRWIIENLALSNMSHLLDLSDYVVHMKMVRGVAKSNPLGKGSYAEMCRYLYDDKELLRTFEAYLNQMGVKCKLVVRKLPDGTHEMYFKHDRLVPFYSTASSGTISAVELYRNIFMWEKAPSFLYLDEFDALYHYEMAEKLFSFIKREYPSTQVVITSHNTNLMTNRLVRPDCVAILSVSGQLTTLLHATSRDIREAHNLEKMYISGEFVDVE